MVAGGLVVVAAVVDGRGGEGVVDPVSGGFEGSSGGAG